ncbi:MAG: hypothetical protein R2939_08805 [Kofleriaceae bacterium]
MVRKATAPTWAMWMVAALAAAGCGGDGCGAQPIPGGFPAAEREPNAVQLRITDTGLATLAADPDALVGGLLPGGLAIDVPASCGGTPAICCPGGVAQVPCGPIDIDLSLQPGDAPRLELTPIAGQSRLDLVVRARVSTAMDIPLDISIADCGLRLDTGPGDDPDLKISTTISFVQDPQAGTTRIEVGDVAVDQLTEDDVEITGNALCQLADLGVGFALDFLVDTFANQIQSAIGDQVCKSCPGGTLDECGPFAASCDDGVCMKGNDTCLQELGVSGRLAGLLASLSPGTTGAIDLYEVAGGYATTDGGGLALGLLGGMEPGGVARDRCGPSAPAPADVTIPPSVYFQGNTRPDTGAAYGLGLGLHASQLDQFAWAAYEGGALCLTIGSGTVDLLSSDTIGLFVPSLLDLIDYTAPISLGVRPQAPPTIVLGRNTFTVDGEDVVVDEPLLDVTFDRLELDFFAALEDQHVRLFTLVADVHLEVGLQVGADGQLTPVLGDLDGAFSNLSVINTSAITEDPEDIAALFPAILDLALPGLAGGLSPIALPDLGGLAIDVQEITAVDDLAFLALYGDLVPATMAAAVPRVETTATVLDWHLPDDDVLSTPARWAVEPAPSVRLALGARTTDDVEFSIRTHGGTWSAWNPARVRTVTSPAFWLAGTHAIEVRARKVGQAWSTDPTPEVIVLPVGPAGGARALAAGFHGQADAAGCSGCAARGGDAGGLLLLVGVVALGLGRRRRQRGGGAPLLLAACVIVGGGLVGGAAGCDCGGARAATSSACPARSRPAPRAATPRSRRPTAAPWCRPTTSSSATSCSSRSAPTARSWGARWSTGCRRRRPPTTRRPTAAASPPRAPTSACGARSPCTTAWPAWRTSTPTPAICGSRSSAAATSTATCSTTATRHRRWSACTPRSASTAPARRWWRTWRPGCRPPAAAATSSCAWPGPTASPRPAAGRGRCRPWRPRPTPAPTPATPASASRLPSTASPRCARPTPATARRRAATSSCAWRRCAATWCRRRRRGTCRAAPAPSSTW